MGRVHVIWPGVKSQILKRLKELGVQASKLAEEHGLSLGAPH